MELVEPLLLTISSLRELVQSNAEIANEVSDLGDTIGLIEVAIRPLFATPQDDPHLRDILGALQQSMINAKSALERVVRGSSTSISQRLMSWFRSNNDLSELKSHQDKLKTLCPILSLAITTSQQNKKGINESDHGFDALRLIKNEDTKQFWAHHFGPKTFKVTWLQFRAAFEHELQEQLDTSHIELLRQQLDRNSDGDVDIYELANFSGEISLFESFRQLISQPSTQRHKRPAPPNSEREARKEQPSSKKPRNDLNKPVMGPPLASLSKMRFSLAPDIHHVPLVDDESEDSQYAYKLLLFAREEIFQMKGCKDIRTIYCLWQPDTPFVLGRMMMEHLPKDLLVRISRAHFEIHCGVSRSLNDSTEYRQFWIRDTSGNGTFINGKRLTKGKKMLLHSGDQIGIVTDKDHLLVEMGYTFQPINCLSYSGTDNSQDSQELRLSPSHSSPSSSSPSSQPPNAPLSSATPDSLGSSPSPEDEDIPCTPPKGIPTIVVTPPPSPSKESGDQQFGSPTSIAAVLAESLQKLRD